MALYFLGANYPPLRSRLEDSDGDAFDNLSTYTLTAVRINDANGAVLVAAGTISVIDAADATFNYTPGGTDIAAVGTFTIRVTFTKGTQIFILDLPEKMIVK